MKNSTAIIEHIPNDSNSTKTQDEQDDKIESQTSDEDEEKSIFGAPKEFWGARHNFALLGFMGLASVYMMRINLSVAIVDMVNSTTESTESFFSANPTNITEGQCTEDGNSEDNNNGEFGWDGKDQGLILGAFFWGYCLTQIPGGILAERFGGKVVFGMGVLFTDFFCLLTPVAARSSKELLIAVRVLTGLAEGVTFPAVNSMISRWIPNSERTTIGSFILAGTQIGTVIALPLSGVLCSIELDNGWPFAFYVPGAVGVFWLIAWYFLVFDSPANHPRIDEDEKRYILSSITTVKAISLSDTPWKAMLTSIHLWAILFAHYGFSWGFSMLLTELPTYMKTVLHFDLKANGLLSALPYLSMWITSIIFSLIADMLRKKKILSMTAIRKVFTTIGLLLPAFGLIGASYTGCDRYATVGLITASTGFTGAVYSGLLANHIDLAPNYAGTMMGITNCVAQTSGFLAPFVVGVIVTDSGSLQQWQTVFFLSAGIYAATNLFYVIFATAEEQPWNSCIKRNDVELVKQDIIVNETK